MYRVDETTCTGCGDCMDACPAEAVSLVEGRAQIDDATCADCGSCADACPQGAIVIADDASPAYSTIGLGTSIPTIIPAAASVEARIRAQRPEVEVLAAEPRRSRLWPTVGGALVWAARELLPEMLAVWRTSRAEVLQPTSRKSVTFGQVVSQHSRTGHRHRWGRA